MSMTDRELLELAAKAAGHAIDPIDAMHDPDDWACWNPLADDGDALRLAVKCKIAICTMLVDGLNRDQHESIATSNKAKIWGFSFNHNGDPCAATRRAIVRAAAEIGRAMP